MTQELRRQTFTVYMLCSRGTEEHSNEGTYLYVGYTSNIGRRLSEHVNDKWWWGDVTDVIMWNFDSYDEAVDKERELIKKFRPVYNYRGVLSPYVRPSPPRDVYRELLARVEALESAQRCPR